MSGNALLKGSDTALAKESNKLAIKLSVAGTVVLFCCSITQCAHLYSTPSQRPSAPTAVGSPLRHRLGTFPPAAVRGNGAAALKVTPATPFAPPGIGGSQVLRQTLTMPAALLALLAPIALLAMSFLRPRRPQTAIAPLTGMFRPGRSPSGRRSTARRTSQHPSTDRVDADLQYMGMAPVPVLEPKTPTGELLEATLQGDPKEFPRILRERVERLSSEIEEQSSEFSHISFASRPLYRRINGVKTQERSLAIEDILYYSVFYEFMTRHIVPVQPEQLKGRVQLTPIRVAVIDSCASNDEERLVVEAHLHQILSARGPLLTSLVGKYHLFEIFGTSLLFGYFLRQTGRRFALARSCGLVEATIDDLKYELERLFNSPSAGDVPDSYSRQWSPKRATLKEYVDHLSPREVMDSMLMSKEATAVVQSYVRSLFGDTRQLALQMRDAVKRSDVPIRSPAELRLRMAQAVQNNLVDTVLIDPVDVRRLALEAIAFGCFLKEAETTVELNAERPLLNPAAFLSLLSP